MRPHGEWADVSSPTTVLPRRPRGVVPHADFRAALGTSWSPPPALQPLGHHLTLDAPTGLLAAAAVPVEAYAGAELRFTPAAAEPADEPREPAAAKPRLLDRILGRPEPALTPTAVPSPPPPLLSTPESPELPNRGTEGRLALHRPESRPTLAAASTPTVFRTPEAQPLLAHIDPSHRSGPAPVEEMPPLAGPLPIDPGADADVDHVAAVAPAPSRRSGPAGSVETPRVAGPLRHHEPSVPAAQRPLLGHRALGADLMAAAAEVVLPRPVAALAPVALPAPVASRATAAPGGPDLAPPRPAGMWDRPVARDVAPGAGYATSTAPVAGPSRSTRASAGPAFEAAPPQVERDVELPAPPAGPVEPEPGLPDWWPAQSTTWDVADADPGSAPVGHVADRAPTLDLPDLAELGRRAA